MQDGALVANGLPPVGETMAMLSKVWPAGLDTCVQGATQIVDNQPIRPDGPTLAGRDHRYPVQAIARAIGRAGETCILLPLPMGILLDQRFRRMGASAARKVATARPSPGETIAIP